MREQKAQLSIPRRASATVEEQGQRHYTTRVASPHRAGHYAGLHPEDQPYYTTNTRTRRPPQVNTDEEEDIYEERSRSSAVRYRPLYEERLERAVSAYQPSEQPQEKRRPNFLVFIGIALLVMLVGYVAISLLGNWWQHKMDDLTYGNPRTYHFDADVGHYGHPSHFIVLNLQGYVEVIETQAGYPQNSHIYPVMRLRADQADVPVTATVQDVNGDGKPDLVVNTAQVSTPLYNNGQTFQLQPLS